MRAAFWTAKPNVQVWFNGIFTLIWLIMLPITLLLGGTLETVLWVSFISAWALFATHLGAWIAALVNVRAEKLEGHADRASGHRADLHAKLDHIIENHPDIPPFDDN